MRFRNIVLVWIVILALCLVPVFLRRPPKERDMVYYNSAVSAICEGEDPPEGCEVIMAADDGYEARLNSYYRSGALIMDITKDGTVVGKAVWDDAASMRQEQERSLFIKLVSIWGITAAAGTLLLILVYIRYLRPFNKLQKFTGEVARGNLDFPLSVGRRDFFGNFTESFDIMREELKAARAKEAAMQKAKQEMLAELSHDIRTPLAIIGATCEVMEVTSADPSIPEKTEIIRSKVGTIDSLIDNMMAASLAEAEELKVEPREESSLLISSMIGSLSDAATIKEEGELPQCLLWYDPLRLEQVIDNIAGNSIKYAGTPITVTYGRTDNGVLIKISDEGPGVPEEELSLLTQKFFRGKGSDGRPGSGLGLYLADYFMKKMDGDISFRNGGKDGGFVAEIFIKKVV